MNNENLEQTVSKKTKSSKVLLVVLGLVVLGIVTLIAGINIFSKLSVSADTLPPIPGDPLVEPSPSVGISTQPSSTTTISVSPSPQPPTPPTPGGPPITITIKSGWSIISGTTLFSYDMAPITQRGIYFYSYNDPYLSNRNWLVSANSCSGQSDFFCTTSSVKFRPRPFLGYYMYNPGSQVSLTLNQITNTPSIGNEIYARGWHLMHYNGSSTTKGELLRSHSFNYANSQGVNLIDAVSENLHLMSNKIYVVVNSSNITSSSVKELTDTDSATTISKIPSNSYFWIYIRRAKNPITSISGGVLSATSPLPNQSAITNVIMPPVPPIPN